MKRFATLTVHRLSRSIPVGLFTALLVTGLLLTACQPAPPAAGSNEASAEPAAPSGGAATAAPNDVTGPGGGSVVTASDGVLLLTPGAPLPTPDVSDLLAELHAFAAADLESDPLEGESAAGEPPAPPAEPVDAATLELPEGISLYPGAADLEVSPAGESMNYVVFYTTDAPTAVLEAYAQQAEAAQYSNISLDLPNQRGEYDGSWMKSGLILTVTAYPGDRIKVMLAWMEM